MLNSPFLEGEDEDPTGVPRRSGSKYASFVDEDEGEFEGMGSPGNAGSAGQNASRVEFARDLSLDFGSSNDAAATGSNMRHISRGDFSSYTLRRRVYLIVSGAASHTEADFASRSTGPTMWLSKAFEWFIVFMICSCILLVMLQSEVSIAEARSFKVVYELFNWAALIVFTLEYYLRIWSCVENPALKPRNGSVTDVQARWRWAKKPMSVLDIIATASFYIDLFLDLKFGQELYSCAILSRGSHPSRRCAHGEAVQGVQTLRNVLSNRLPELGLCSFIASVILLSSSILIYYFENGEQPETFSSIFVCMYWAAITMTTVGYGDMSPITGVGRVIGALLGLVGIALFAIPAGIIGSGFTELMDDIKLKKKRSNSRASTARSGEGDGAVTPRTRATPLRGLQLHKIDDDRGPFSSSFDVNDLKHLAAARQVLFRGGASSLPSDLADKFKLDAGLEGFSGRNPSVPLGLQLAIALKLSRTLLDERLGSSTEENNE